jgi:NADPH-dependent curcumin reductase CurA
VFQLALRSATMQGVNIFDYMPEAETGVKTLHAWAKEGKLKSADTIRKGTIGDAPKVLVELFDGKNTGKMLLEVKDPEA